MYTSLIVNVILRRFAARAKCSRHHGVNLASPCIFKGFVEKKELQGGRSSTSTSPSTLRTNCSLLLNEENKVSVGCTSLSDYLLKGPLLDQRNLDQLLKGGGRAPRPDQGSAG